MEEEGKFDLCNLVKVIDIGQGVIYKDELVIISVLKVFYFFFLDGEVFVYCFDIQGKWIVFFGDMFWFLLFVMFVQGVDILVYEVVYVFLVVKLVNSIGNGKMLVEVIVLYYIMIEDVGKIVCEVYVKKLVLSYLVFVMVVDDVW